jgi:hypothetical protein
VLVGHRPLAYFLLELLEHRLLLLLLNLLRGRRNLGTLSPVLTDVLAIIHLQIVYCKYKFII